MTDSSTEPRGYVEDLLERRDRLRNHARTAALGVALLGVFWYLSTKVPEALLESADARARDCFSVLARHAGGDPTTCRQSVRLFLPRLAQSTRERAEKRRRSQEQAILTHALDAATATAPDAKARERAARAMLESPDVDRNVVVRTLVAGGAFPTLAELEPRGTEDRAAIATFAAAIATGNDERARSAAKVSVARDQYDASLRRGAWLCLGGDKADGLRALVDADRGYRSIVHTNPEGWDKARVAIVACGGREGDVGFDPSVVGSVGRDPMFLALLADPSWQQGRRRTIADKLLDATNVSSDDRRVSAIALSLHEGPRPLDELLTMIAPTEYRQAIGLPSVDPLVSPWAALERRERYGLPYVVSPTWLDDASAALENAALAAPATLPATDKDGVDRVDAAVRKEPALHFRRAAWILSIEAGSEWARRGAAERARSSLDRAVRCAPPQAEWVSAPARLAAGDAEGAALLLERCADEGSKVEPAERFRCALNLALARAALGRFEAARAAAVSAHELLRSPAMSKEATQRDLTAAAWLRLALERKVGGRSATVPGLPLPPDKHEVEVGGTLAVSFWQDLSAMPEDKRRARRADVPHLSDLTDVPPAVLFVVGSAAEGAGDIEVWLDRVFSRELAKGSQSFFAARAEAARWRGDAEAVARWEAALRGLRDRVKDDRAAILAGLGGF